MARGEIIRARIGGQGKGATQYATLRHARTIQRRGEGEEGKEKARGHKKNHGKERLVGKRSRRKQKRRVARKRQTQAEIIRVPVISHLIDTGFFRRRNRVPTVQDRQLLSGNVDGAVQQQQGLVAWVEGEPGPSVARVARVLLYALDLVLLARVGAEGVVVQRTDAHKDVGLDPFARTLR